MIEVWTLSYAADSLWVRRHAQTVRGVGQYGHNIYTKTVNYCTQYVLGASELWYMIYHSTFISKFLVLK